MIVPVVRNGAHSNGHHSPSRHLASRRESPARLRPFFDHHPQPSFAEARAFAVHGHLRLAHLVTKIDEASEWEGNAIDVPGPSVIRCWASGASVEGQAGEGRS